VLLQERAEENESEDEEEEKANEEEEKDSEAKCGVLERIGEEEAKGGNGLGKRGSIEEIEEKDFVQSAGTEQESFLVPAATIHCKPSHLR
jgi:hypothetical protein